MMIKVGNMSGLKGKRVPIFLDGLCYPLYSPFVTFVWPTRCASRVILFYFYFFSSLISSQITRRKEKKTNKEKKKMTLEVNEAPITTSSISLKRSRQNNSNDTKECHKRWTRWATRAVQKFQGSLIFGPFVWPTPIIDDGLPWYHWDSSRRGLSSGTDGVIIGVSMCLPDLFLPFFLSFFFFISSLFIESCV
jgi:hypothetical protein